VNLECSRNLRHQVRTLEVLLASKSCSSIRSNFSRTLLRTSKKYRMFEIPPLNLRHQVRTLRLNFSVFKSFYSATLNTFLLAPSSAGRGGRTISGKQRIGFGAAAGAQQLYSSITQARSGTATPLNSKAHITARGTFDG